MGIAVLGPLVCDDVPAFGRRDRALLTALALCVGRAVTADQLAEAIWGETLPRSAHKSLQGGILRLRRALGADLIETSPHGYRLHLPPDEVDFRRFERLVGRGRELLVLGEPERASFSFAQALSLWRGRAFEDIESWDLATIEAGRLDELRLEAEELRVEAALKSGRHLEVLAAAEGMVRAQPMRERRWQLLALAQYQAGRQTEALRTVRRVKALLADRLGLDPGPELASLEEAILRQDESLIAGGPLPATDTCPYRGLLFYDIEDTETFFGRESDVRACVAILHERGTLSVVGPSGSGKSSLARAGVAAELRRQGYQVVGVAPGAHPMQALASLPRPMARTVLLVDQAEEVFSLCKEETERKDFFATLVKWAQSGPLVLAMRADRLAEVSAHPTFARLLERGLYLLGAMSEQGLRDAIEAPARQAGLLVEPGLVDLLMVEVGGVPGALPMLSHALQETWKRREANTLTVAGYKATGGIRGAVAQSAERLYGSIDPARRLLLRHLVLRLVSSGAQGEPVRTQVSRQIFVGDPDQEQLIDLLVGSRLVTSDAGVVEIAHEALARAWPRLRAWLDDDLEGQRILHHLTTAATAWDALGRPDSELYRGVRLAQALEWKNSQDARLTADEIAFLRAAERSEQSEQRAAHERARAQSRLIHRLRDVLVVASVLLVLAVAAGVAALRQQGKAEHNATRAVANAEAAVVAETRAEARSAAALALNTDDIDESMLLAVAGVKLADSPETRSSLLAALGRHPELIESLQMAGPEVMCFEVSPDESTVATYDRTNHVRLYDVHSGDLLAQFQAGSSARLNWIWRGLRFSPDGQILAVTMAAPSRHPVELLNAHTLAPLESQPRGTKRWRWQLNSITFSQDGRRLASIGSRVRGQADTTHPTSTWGYVWELDAPHRPVARMPLDSYGAALAIDAHGRTIYTAGPLARHDVASGRTVLLPEPWGVDEPAEIVDMSPTGRYLAASGPGGVALLDPRTGELRRQMRVEADDDGFWVTFSDDGRRVAAIDANDQAAMVWKVASGELLARLPLSNAGEFTDLGKDGSTLYTEGTDSALRQWDLDGERRFIPQVAYVPPDIGNLSFVRPSPGGQFIAYPVGDDIVFFDVRAGTLGKPLPRGSGYQRSATASWHPDGVHFALATEGQIRIWDARTGTLTARGRPVGRSITAIDFSTDGSRLVVGELSGQVTLLDTTDLTAVGRPVQLDESIRDVAAGPDNHTAVAVIGYENKSRFWAGSSHHWAQVDLDAGSVLQSGALDLNAGVIDLSPDGRHVAIGGDGALLVLDLQTGRPVREAITAHETLVAITYSPDGTRILTSGDDASNGLWDGRSGELLARFGTPQLVTEAGFGHDPSSVLVAPLFGGSVYEWHSRPNRAIAFACRVAGRDFTEHEWTQLFGTRPYQPTCP